MQIDVRLDEVVLRALEKNPELRYQQVSEVKTCVETILTPKESVVPVISKPRKKSQARNIVVSLCAGLFVGLAVILLTMMITASVPEDYVATARIKVDSAPSMPSGAQTNVPPSNNPYDPYLHPDRVRDHSIGGRAQSGRQGLGPLSSTWATRGGEKLGTLDTVQLLRSRLSLRPVRKHTKRSSALACHSGRIGEEAATWGKRGLPGAMQPFVRSKWRKLSASESSRAGQLQRQVMCFRANRNCGNRSAAAVTIRPNKPPYNMFRNGPRGGRNDAGYLDQFGDVLVAAASFD